MTIVLDRSGSMHGDKLANSKNSMKGIVNSMNPNDIINIVLYSDDAIILVEKGTYDQKNEILDKIDGINVVAMTNLYAGLELGYRLTRKSSDEPLRNKRLFLFSDGLVNMGQTKAENILNLVKSSEIPTNSFGVGSDFDRNLMPAIAYEGKGEFFFIESALSIEKVIQITSRGFIDLIGAEAELKAFCPPGLNLTKVYGKDVIDGGFRVGDLRMNDSLSFFLEFGVEPKLFVKPEAECFYTLTYKNISTGKKEVLKGSLLKVELTSEEENLKKIDDEVKNIFKIQKSMETQKQVQRFLEKDEVDKAVLLLDVELTKMNDVKEEIEDEDNKRIAETATRRVKAIKKRTMEKRKDKEGNIETSKQAYYLTGSASQRYDDL